MTRAEILAAVKAGKSLAGANLCGANLRGANLSKAILCGATIDGMDVGDDGLGGPGRYVWCLTGEEQDLIEAHREGER